MSTAMQTDAAEVRSRALFSAAAMVMPRRPFVDDDPDGLVESDLDWIRNNHDAVVAFLEAATAEENLELTGAKRPVK